MENAVANARDFTELLSVGDEGPYVFSRMFSSEGGSERRRSKHAFKLLKKIDEPLRAMLRDGERVSFLTSGVAQPSFLEMYFLGWALYYLQRRAIAVTNARILLIQIDSRGRPKEIRNQISYNAIDALAKTWLGNIKIQFRSGATAQLTGVPRVARKPLARLFEKGFRAFDATPADTVVENLCPHCYAPAARFPSACPSCGGAFKSPRTAALLSLTYPGAGDVYLGHGLFAVFEILVATVFWLFIAVFAFDPTFGLTELAVLVVAMLVFVHGIDAFATRHLARKGLQPASGTSDAWRFGVAGVVPVLCLAAILLSAPAKAKLRPSQVAVAGDLLSAEHLDALRSAGHVAASETVRYFYSDGPGTVLQDGNLFTDDRIVSYVMDVDSTWVWSARFDEVVDLQVEPGGPGDALSSIYVVPADAQAFRLIVATEGEGDRQFAAAMVDRWREVRAAGDDVWFDGGSGESVDDAVLIRGMTSRNPEEIGSLERWWLGIWFGREGEDWDVEGRTTSRDGETELSIVTIGLPEGESRKVVFRSGS